MSTAVNGSSFCLFGGVAYCHLLQVTQWLWVRSLNEAELSAAAQVNSCQTHLGEEAAQMMKINDSLPVWLLTLTLMRGRLIHSSPPHLANRATDFPSITSLVLRSFLWGTTHEEIIRGLRAHHHHHRDNNTALRSSEYINESKYLVCSTQTSFRINFLRSQNVLIPLPVPQRAHHVTVCVCVCVQVTVTQIWFFFHAWCDLL